MPEYHSLKERGTELIMYAARCVLRIVSHVLHRPHCTLNATWFRDAACMLHCSNEFILFITDWCDSLSCDSGPGSDPGLRRSNIRMNRKTWSWTCVCTDPT